MVHPRRRSTALAVVVLGLGLAAPAYASPEAVGQVIFSGGRSLLGCSSRPDRDGMSVYPQSTVRFVNHLDAEATLHVSGANPIPVGANEAVPVTFMRGPVSVSMVPECGLLA